MKHIYAVRSAEELQAYQSFVAKIQPKLDKFLTFLQAAYSVNALPRAIVWASTDTATKAVSDLPIPAYTNEFRTMFCPDLESWRKIYLKQLAELDAPEIRRYYQENLTENHILQILGHEFVHHSELFMEGFDADYESGIWFEEGMCEYISRRYFLTESQFEEEAAVNAALVARLQGRYGNHSLEDFGAATYAGDYASIFFEYWRSFLAVQEIVERFDGDVMAVFREYHRWHHEGNGMALREWFRL